MSTGAAIYLDGVLESLLRELLMAVAGKLEFGLRVAWT